MAKYLDVAKKSGSPPRENKSASPRETETSVTYASSAAEDAAKEAGLTAAHFKGVKPSGEKGYTKADVDAAIAKQNDGDK